MGIRTAELQAAWAHVEARYGSYRLVLPGEPSFICQPHSCDAYCCRAFNVALDEGEVERMRASSGWPASRFLESEDGEVLTLPLATPFVLGRREGHCVFLSEELACEQYEGRPDACRSYPHQVVFVDAESGRPAQPSAEAGRRAVEAVVAGGPVEGALPLLLRHDQCPGFTGPPSTAEAWETLLRETYGRSVGGPGEVVSSPP